MESYSRRCPYCAEVIQRAAIICKHCSRDLRASSRVGLVHSILRYVYPLALALGIVSLGVVIAIVLLATVP